MQRQSVSSSDLASVGYEPTSQTLEVEFHNSGIYQYFNVPSIVYQCLMSASSHGKYFSANIKNVYQFRKIR